MSLLNGLHSQSLRRKLVTIATIITCLTLLVTNAAFISLKYYLSHQDVQQKLSVLGEVISNRSSTALTFSDFSMLQADLDTLSADRTVIRGCIYADNQHLAAAYVNLDYSNAKCADYLHTIENTETRSFSQVFPIMLGNSSIGTLYIEASHLDLADRLKTFLMFSVIILIIAMLLSLTLANWLQGMVVRPMKDLGNTLRNIMMRKDYSIRADKKHNDELGDLTDLFNNLLRAVENENNSLKASEERFRKLTALSPVGIFQIDTKQRLQYVNQRWRDIHSIPSINPSIQDWFDCIHPDDVDSIKQHWERLTNSLESISLELRLTNRDKHNTWIQLLATPLIDKQGALLGYLGTITDISELKAAQIQMENLAFYDPLTGLANRRLFRDRLEKSILSASRSDSPVALMFLDMDQFKRVNDTLGHDAGDLLLKEVARRLSGIVRETDTVSRIGGDEFTVLLTDVHNSSDVFWWPKKSSTLWRAQFVSKARIL